MKSIKRFLAGAAVALAAVTVPLSAFAESDYAAIITAIDSTGGAVFQEPVAITPAGEGKFNIISNYKPTGDEADVTFEDVYDQYKPVKEGEGYVVTINEQDPASKLETIKPEPKMAVVINYVTYDSRPAEFQTTISDTQSANGEINVTLEELPDDMYTESGYASVMTQGNRLAAILNVKDGTAYADWSSGIWDVFDKYKWFIIGGGAVLVALIAMLIVILSKNKSGQIPSAPGGQYIDGAGFDGFGDNPEGGFDTGYNGYNGGDYAENFNGNNVDVDFATTNGGGMQADLFSDNVPPNIAGAISVKGFGGRMDGRIYNFDGYEMSFGRSRSNTVIYPEDTKGVSRHHCRLFMNNGQLMLVDDGSTYGTFVKGKGRLTPNVPVPITRGEAFYIGDKRNKFVVG